MVPVRKPALIVLFEQIHGVDPEEVPLIMANQLSASGDLPAQQAHHRLRFSPPIRDDQDEVIGTRTGGRLDRRHLAFAHVPVERTWNPGQAPGTCARGDQSHLVKLAAAHVPTARHGEAAHDTSGVERRAQDCGACRAECVAYVRDLQAVTQVGFVGAVLQQRLLHVDPWEGRRDLDPQNVLPDFRPEAFDQGEDVFLGAERHLHVELSDLDHAICPKAFITKASRDLAVPAATAISPVAIFGFSDPPGRRVTLPLTRTTYSFLTSVSPIDRITTCTRPQRSRRSMNVTPPWSRRRATQPYSSTSRPSSLARSEPQWGAENPLMRGASAAPPTRALPAHRLSCHAVGLNDVTPRRESAARPTSRPACSPRASSPPGSSTRSRPRST